MAKGGAVLKRQTGYRFRGSWLDAALSLILVLSLGCGHIVRNAPNHPGVVFDFEHPPCSPAMKPTKTLPDDEVEIRYLGAAGLYLHWGGNSILLGPFFSNPSFLHALFGRWRADEMAIERGLAGVPVSEVEAVFAGHSHYDHIGDLPIILSRAGRAQVFVNRSGVHALAPYATARSTSFEDKIGEWVWLNQPSGERAPIRFLAVPSDHAPQVDHYLWAKGKTKRAWREPWSSHYFHSLKAGQTFALVIDLMANDLRTVRYRIYYQDAASRRGVGEPPSFPDGHPYDLAVLCMASYDKAPGQPESILGILHPRHVMVTHYEDFFQSQDRPVRFVGLLTNGKVDRYLRTICVKLGCEGQSSAGPITPVCGPSGAR
ncbi:MAG TPA: MBL fold metallo-hydrolase, partial [Thermoanaerobaculia bacterium]|nr:MBL fold metallo-hydrolase [Thermoanaerobaculia bacterium]